MNSLLFFTKETEQPSALSRGVPKLPTGSRLPPYSVIPAHAGIQSLPHGYSATTLDARLRGHDGLSLRLKARGFNHPRRGH